MKQICFLLLFLSAFFFSCEKIKDATTVDFDTNVELEVPVSIQQNNAKALKSAASYPFSESGTASLRDNPEIKDYLNLIKSIEIKSVVIKFSNLQPSEIIETISVSATGVGTLATIKNVTSANSTHTPAIDNAKLNQLAGQLKSSKSVTLTVSGSTNSAPMTFYINTDFKIHVEASPL